MKEMKIWIITDLEGVAGVFSFEECSSGKRYEIAKSLLTQEVNAAIEGALEMGAKEILVVDSHGPGGIRIEELHPEAKLLGGRPIPLPWGLEEGFDAAFIIGQHAMAGIEKAHLSHTMSHVNVQNIWLNGARIGEIGIIAAIAGYFDVPVVLVTGDEAACAEARNLIPNIKTVAVKKGITHGSAISVTPVKARKMIKEGAKEALKMIDKIEPYKVKAPIELIIEYSESGKRLAEILSQRPGLERVDGRTVRIRGEDLLEVLKKWRA